MGMVVFVVQYLPGGHVVALYEPGRQKNPAGHV
jgi:hypothetical protein